MSRKIHTAAIATLTFDRITTQTYQEIEVPRAWLFDRLKALAPYANTAGGWAAGNFDPSFVADVIAMLDGDDQDALLRECITQAQATPLDTVITHSDVECDA